jgi:transposase-like protein
MIAARRGLLARTPVHYVAKHLRQGIESDHFWVKRPMLRVGGFRSFHTARRTICGFEAMVWLRMGLALPARGPFASSTVARGLLRTSAG